MATEKLHSTIGASSSKRWLNCPGSIKLIKDAPERPSGTFADEGTDAHELAEICLIENKDAEAFLGRIMDKGFEVTRGMAEAVQIYLDYVRGIMKVHPRADIAVEYKMTLEWIDPDAFGTNDCNIAVPFDTLYVIDYKHGAGVPVEVKNNPQGLYYILGAAKQYGFNFKKFRFVIVQPRAPHSDGPIRTCEYTLDEVKIFEKKIIAGIAKVRHFENTGEKWDGLSCGDWCQFCPASIICPEIKKTAIQQAQQTFARVPYDDILQETKITPVDPKDLDKFQLGRALEFAGVLSGWIKDLEKYADEQAIRGNIADGHKLVRRRSHRAFRDNADDMVGALKMLGFKNEDIYTEPKLKTPAQIEKLKGVKKEFVNSFVDMSEPGYELVPLSDSRQAAQAPAITAFGPAIEGAKNNDPSKLF